MHPKGISCKAPAFVESLIISIFWHIASLKIAQFRFKTIRALRILILQLYFNAKPIVIVKIKKRDADGWQSLYFFWWS